MTIPGTPDPQEWLQGYQQRIAALKEKAEKARAQMADNRVELTSENGHVKLAVNGAGALQTIEITDAASTAKPSELSKTIMQTYRKAVAQAGARTMEIMSGLGGRNSQAMEIIKDAVPPEPEEDTAAKPGQPAEMDLASSAEAEDPDDEGPPPLQNEDPPPAAQQSQPEDDYDDEDDEGFQGVWNNPDR